MATVSLAEIQDEEEEVERRERMLRALDLQRDPTVRKEVRKGEGEKPPRIQGKLSSQLAANPVMVSSNGKTWERTVFSAGFARASETRRRRQRGRT